MKSRRFLAAGMLQVFQIAFHVEGFQLFVLAQIQGMMRVPLFGDGAGAVLAGAVLPADFQHIPDALGQVRPLFNDGTPGSPDGGRF